jgi:hypothetical protein
VATTTTSGQTTGGPHGGRAGRSQTEALFGASSLSPFEDGDGGRGTHQGDKDDGEGGREDEAVGVQGVLVVHAVQQEVDGVGPAPQRQRTPQITTRPRKPGRRQRGGGKRRHARNGESLKAHVGH